MSVKYLMNSQEINENEILLRNICNIKTQLSCRRFLISSYRLSLLLLGNHKERRENPLGNKEIWESREMSEVVFIKLCLLNPVTYYAKDRWRSVNPVNFPNHLSFFSFFFILEELYLMVHTFIIQILGFLEFFFSSS